LAIRSNDRVNFEDLDLDNDDQRQVLHGGALDSRTLFTTGIEAKRRS